MKKFMLAIISVLLVGGGVTYAYANNFRKPTPMELYRAAIDNAVSGQDKEPYITFKVEADDSIIDGEFKGDLSGEDGSMRMDFDINSKFGDVPIAMSAEMILESRGGKEESYLKYKSIKSPNSEYSQNVIDYYAPVVNKWILMENNKDEKDTATNFEGDGALAALDALGVFAPITTLSDADQAIFKNILDKYAIYEVDGAIEGTRYRGIETRKLKVSVKKDVFIEFDRELSEELSKEADYRRSEKSFIDQLFGEDNTLSADVFLNKDEAKIIGLDLNVDLDEPIDEKVFDTKLKSIKTSMLVDYERSLTIALPKEYITTAQMNSLLNLE